jgi:membrane-bound lytic murein transglycosylase B
MAKIKDVAEQKKEWDTWLNDLKKEMISLGISKKTINEAYKNDYFHEVKTVFLQDKKQAEFVLTADVYINKLVNKDKVAKAREHYKELSPKYTKLSQEYGVPLNYLIAFWGVETHFGYNKGKHHLIDGLTNLSYKNRRATFFKKELFNVLKIMDTYHLTGDKMMGSWAGAMGHFQFMPSTYNAYAIDYDGDGVSDIWDSFDDAIASAANYLSKLGWKPNEPWGQEVILPWDFDYSLVGLRKYKSVAEWKKIGLIGADGKALHLPNDAAAGVILPDGRRGRAYITLSNFRRIMIWNRSINYALAIVTLADYINSTKTYRPINEKNHYKLTDEDILKVQRFANKTLNSNLKPDGRIGPKTNEAVKKLQKKWKLPQDGVPDYVLLNKISHYKTRADFMVPPQPRKPKRK